MHPNSLSLYSRSKYSSDSNVVLECLSGRVDVASVGYV